MPDEHEGAAPAPGGEPGEPGELSEDEKGFRDFAGVEHTEESDPSWDNKRFRRIYRKYKDETRDKAQLSTDIKLMAEHNRKLAEAAERITVSTEKIIGNEAQKQVDAGQAAIEKMETTLQTLKVDRKAARTEQDWDRVDDLEESISKLDRQIEKQRDKLEAAEKAEKKEPEKKESAERPDQAAIRDFVQGTPWYNMESDDFDPVMVSAAKEYDTALMNKPKYKDKLELTADRLKEVRTYIEKRFGWKKSGDGGNGKDRQSMVEGVGELSGGGEKTRTNVSLSADQKRIAHLMLDDSVGPAKAEAEYLKQLKAIEG